MLATLIRQSKDVAVAKKKGRQQATDNADGSLEVSSRMDTSKEAFFAELKQMKAQEASDLLAMFNTFWIHLRGFYDEHRDILSQEGYIKLFTKLQFAVNDCISENEAVRHAENDYLLHIAKYNAVNESSFYEVLLEFILAHTQNEDLYFYTCFTWALMNAVMFIDVDPPKFKPRREVEFLFANPAFEGELTVNFVQIKQSPEFAKKQERTEELYHQFRNGTLVKVKNVVKSRNTKANVAALGQHELSMLEALGRKFKNNANSIDTDSESGDDGGGSDNGNGVEISESTKDGETDAERRRRLLEGIRKARKVPKISRDDRSYYFFANQGEGSDLSYVPSVLEKKNVDLSYLRKGIQGMPQRKGIQGTVAQEMSFSKGRERRERGKRQVIGGAFLKSNDFNPLRVLETTPDTPLPAVQSPQLRADSGHRFSVLGSSGGRDCSPKSVSRDKSLASLSQEKHGRLNEVLSDSVLPDFLKIAKAGNGDPGSPSSPFQSSRLPPLSPKKEKGGIESSFVLSVNTSSKAPAIKADKPPPRKLIRRSVLDDGKSMSDWIGQSLDFIKNRDNITSADNFSHHPFNVGRDSFCNILGNPESGDTFYDDSSVATNETHETLTTVSNFAIESLEDPPLSNQQAPFLNNRRTEVLFQEVLEKKRNDLVRLNKLLHPLYTENNSIKIEAKKTAKAKAAEIKYPLHDLLFSLNKRAKSIGGAKKKKSSTDSSSFQPKKESLVPVTFPNYQDKVSNHAKLVKLAAFSEILKEMVQETDTEEIDFEPYRKFFMAVGTDNFQAFQQQSQEKQRKQLEVSLVEERKLNPNLCRKVGHEETADVDLISPSIFHTFITRSND